MPRSGVSEPRLLRIAATIYPPDEPVIDLNGVRAMGVASAMRIAIVCLCSLQLTACVTAPVVSTAVSLDRLYEEYFEAQLQLSPASATYLGDERYNDQLENPASAAFDSENEAIEKRFLQRVRAVGNQGLTPVQQISYDIRTIGFRQRPAAFSRRARLPAISETWRGFGALGGLSDREHARRRAAWRHTAAGRHGEGGPPASRDRRRQS